MSINVKWLAQSTIYRDSIDLLAVVDYGNGDRAVAKRVEFTLDVAGHQRHLLKHGKHDEVEPYRVTLPRPAPISAHHASPFCG